MFNEYVKTLCPVCDQNILLKTFRLHMEVDEIHKEFATLIEEQVYTTLLHSTELKNNINNVYFNWDYYLQTKYPLSDVDRNNYKNVKAFLKTQNLPPSNRLIAFNLAKLDPKYAITKLVTNVIWVLETTC